MNWPNRLLYSSFRVRTPPVWGCACLLIAFFGCISPVSAQEPAPVPTKNQAMIQVLTSDTTDPQLRLQQAQALLQDPSAYPDLIQILDQSSQTDTKIILCKAIASLANQTVPPPQLTSRQTQAFIDPLFHTLYSGHDELAMWSARALAACHDGILNRLSDTALDPESSLDQRITSIQALQWIPSRNTSLILSALLDDPQPALASAAAEILRKLLDWPPSMSIEEFKKQGLPLLQNMTDQEFMQRQILVRENLLALSRQQNQEIRQTEKLWQTRYFKMLDGEFEKLPDDPARLKYLRQFLQENTDESLKLWAMQCINTWCSSAAVQTAPLDSSLVELLTPYIADPQESVRLYAITSLGKLVNASQPIAQNLLNQLAQEKSPRNQAAILEVMGTLVYLPAVDPAMELLQSPHPAVIAQAARALGKICSSQLPSLTDQQVVSTLQKMSACYARWPQSPDIRKELILAMVPIGMQERFHAHAITNFDALLKSALADSDETIRRSAVQALASLHRHQVLPLLLQERNLLNDPNPAVRFAVIDAVKNFGGTDHLPILRQRLASETNIDTAESLRGAFIQILATLPLADIFQVTQSLANASQPGEQLLFEQAVLTLWEKIAQAKTAGQTIDPALEIFALKSQADIAVIHNQIPQAMKWYQSLLNADLPEEKKDLYRLALIHLALQNSDDDALNENPRLEFQKLFPRPAAKQALDQIEQQYSQLDKSNESQLLLAGRILADWIVPIQKFPDDPGKQLWNQRTRDVLLLLIDQGEKLLQAGQENPILLALLPRLDPRLNPYPASDTVEKRKAAWQQYRQILQPSAALTPNSPPPPPATPETPKPNP